MMNCISHRLLPRRAHCLENSPELQPPSSDVSLATSQTPPSVLEQIMLVSRLVYLTVIFSPSFLLYGLGYLFNSSYLSELAWRYVLRALQVAGPAFIKLGQWASVRRDIFSEEFCRTLSNLHTRCDPHHWRDTVRILEENFGPQWQQTLVILDHTPVGSGCVAQVYKGYLNPETLSPTPENPSSTMDGSSPIAAPVLEAQAASSVYIPVAIKVLHPGVVEDMNRDIGLMRYVASWVDCVYPDVHWVALRECVEEFSESMIKQLDLEAEGRNLMRFHGILANHQNVKFPSPFFPYVTKSVLVESFESGEQISHYLGNPGGELQKKVARIGIDVLLDMLFVYNFTHGDLHPGNILVQDASLDEPRLVLLDCGIATSLQPHDYDNFRQVFTAIVQGDGAKVADLFRGNQPCSNVEKYRQEMAELINSAIQRLNLKETQVAKLFSDLFDILIEHKVRMDPSFANVMVAMMIIEGLGRSLDPALNILEHARPCLLGAAKRRLRLELQRQTTVSQLSAQTERAKEIIECAKNRVKDTLDKLLP